MKIIAGKYKNRNFYMPQGIRPTQNVVRKALFDVLGQDMEGIDFLDLFAGSGAVGLEALSRGAKKVVFVDHDPRCIEVIEKNISLLKINLNPDMQDTGQRLSNGTGFFSVTPWSVGSTDFLKGSITSREVSSYEILSTDSFALVKHLARQGKKFDITYVDPPYGLELAKKALKTMEAHDILHPNSLVIIQHARKEFLPESAGRFIIFRQKRYGNTIVTIYNTIVKRDS